MNEDAWVTDEPPVVSEPNPNVKPLWEALGGSH